MKSSPTRRRAAVVGLVALLSASLSACGGAAPQAAGDASGTPGAKTPLRFGSDVSYAPWETYDSSNQVVGIDADIAALIGKELDRPIEWVNIGYSSLIPSLSAGRYDLIISGMADKAAKRESVSFVDYALPYPTFMVPKGNPKNIKSLKDVCGLTASQAAGSGVEGLVQEASKACQAAGKPPVNIVSVKLSSDIAQGMQSGRADFWLEEVVTHNAAAKAMGGKFEVVKAEGVPTATYGIAFPKKSTELQKQVQEALQRAIDKGETKKIAEKYNLPEEVFLPKATIDKGEG
jgi:polar amino acid transport system substrate-binding protein